MASDKVTVTASIDVSSQRIADMFVGAIEGGSSYWCNDFFPTDSKAKKGFENPWYSDPKFWEQDEFSIAVKWDDGKKIITRKDLVAGVQIFATKEPRHFADMVAETDDATTADVFFQCVVLGEVVYG